MGVERREVAAGPGRDPATQGRELERLREMPQGQTALPKLPLEAGAAGATLDTRRHRGLVDLENTVQLAEIDRHRAAVAVPNPGLDAADDAAATAVGNHGQTPLLTPIQHPPQIVLAGREGDQIRGPFVDPTKAADDVTVGLAHRVGEALVPLIGDR